jgi:hypothetical protein
LAEFASIKGVKDHPLGDWLEICCIQLDRAKDRLWQVAGGNANDLRVEGVENSLPSDIRNGIADFLDARSSSILSSETIHSLSPCVSGFQIEPPQLPYKLLFSKLVADKYTAGHTSGVAGTPCNIVGQTSVVNAVSQSSFARAWNTDDVGFPSVSMCETIGKNWDFSYKEVREMTSSQCFLLVGYYLQEPFVRNGLLRSAETSDFIMSLGEGYQPNPYHNAMHGVDVCSSFVTLLRGCERLWGHALGPIEDETGGVTMAVELNRAAWPMRLLAHEVVSP